MADVIRTPVVRMIRHRMQLFALARQDMSSLAIPQTPSAQVNSLTAIYFPARRIYADACQVANGGCDVNSICSHQSPSNAVVCNCKTGYTNTATGAGVSCTGTQEHIRSLLIVFLVAYLLQIAAK